MGNVKQGNWQGILIYFSTIILFGLILMLAEQRIIEQYYHPAQSVRTFVVLIYIAFAFFWNGTRLLDSEEKKRIFDNNNVSLAKKDLGDT